MATLASEGKTHIFKRERLGFYVDWDTFMKEKLGMEKTSLLFEVYFTAFSVRSLNEGSVSGKARALLAPSESVQCVCVQTLLCAFWISSVSFILVAEMSRNQDCTPAFTLLSKRILFIFTLKGFYLFS